MRIKLSIEQFNFLPVNADSMLENTEMGILHFERDGSYPSLS